MFNGNKNTQTVLLDSEIILDGWNCIEQVEYEKKISSSKLLKITADDDPVTLREVPFLSCELFDSVVAEVNIKTYWRLEKYWFVVVLVSVVDVVVDVIVVVFCDLSWLINHCRSSNKFECNGTINWTGKLIYLPWK